MATNVRVIPATIQKTSAQSSQQSTIRRTAAYARVSTASEEQLTSYEAQVDYYTKYIKEREGWKFVKIYTDEGISATNTKKRDGFNKMVADALTGKIDLIVTKSVSRFARNTVDSLSTIRKLKEKGVEVFFEKENIYTFDGKGELLISLMASIAQEESRAISSNVKWGLRKRFSDGKVSMPYKRFLGYEKGEDGLPKIVEEEAQTVRLIYRMFIEGSTPSSIARQLAAAGILSPGGKKVWQVQTVKSILTNEKYKGDALLQKKFTIDFLTKTTKVNEGEIPQYYVQNSHPAIIDPDEFDVVQAEIERRKKLGRPDACQSPLSTKLICGDCGGYYGSKVWSSNTKYRKVVWQCNDKYKSDTKCTTPHVNEEEVKQKFLEAFNCVLEYRSELIENCMTAKDIICDCSKIEAETGELEQEIEVVTELLRKAIYENAHTAINQDEWSDRNRGYEKRYNHAANRIAELKKIKRQRLNTKRVLETFMRNLKNCANVLTEFDERLWTAAIDSVVILPNGSMTFVFKDGTKVCR